MKKIFIFFTLIIFIAVVAVLSIILRTLQEKGKPLVTQEIEIKREQKMEDLAVNNEQAEQGERYVEGEVLVKFQEDVSQAEIDKLIKDYNLQIVDIIQGINVYRFKLPEGTTVVEILKVLNEDSRVKYAEPNYLFRLY